MAVPETTDDLEQAENTASASAPAPVQVASADAPAAPATIPGYSVDDLVVGPAQRQAITQQLVDIKRRQSGASSAVANETIARLRADRDEVNKAFQATALDPEALKPWDQKAMQNEFRTDPVEAFGSVGSVFAMLAAGFAGVPMEYALDAGAAAIKAVHAGDEKAYNRAFEGWKVNTDLALKRQNLMHQHYTDAVLKMNTNLNAGRSEMELAARQYGDQTAIAMLEAGLDGDLNKVIHARDVAGIATRKAMDELELQHEKKEDLKKDPRFLSPNEALRNAAIRDWIERWSPGGRSQAYYDGRKDFVESQKRANPEYTPEDVLKWNQEFSEAEASGKGTAKTAAASQAAEIERRKKSYMDGGMDEAAAYDKAAQEVKSANMVKKPEQFDSEKTFFEAKAKAKPDFTAEDYALWKREWTEAESASKSAGNSQSSQARKTRAIEELIAQSKADVEAGKRDKPLSLAEAEAQFNRSVATPSGNRLDDIDKQIDQYANGVNAIDTSLSLLNKHMGIAGAAGYATRAAERVGNIFGSNETDRTAFQHKIEYLQLMAPRLFTDSPGRPLSAEAAKIRSIIAGLNIGDTGANTKRALNDVKELWEKMQADNLARRRGSPNALPQQEKPAAPKGGSGPAWQRAPVIGPRSDIGSDEFAA